MLSLIVPVLTFFSCSGSEGAPPPPDTQSSDTQVGVTGRCPNSIGWSQIVAGAYSSCGIHLDGCTECWGYDDADAERMEGHNYADYAYNGDHNIPDTRFKMLSLPEYSPSGWRSQHVCGIDTMGKFHCWGTLNIEFAPPNGVEFVSLSSYSREGACVLDNQGTVRCWTPNLVLLQGEFSEIDSADRQCVRPSDDSQPIRCWATIESQTSKAISGTDLRVGYTGYCTADSTNTLDCFYFSGAPYLEFDGRQLPSEYRDYCMTAYLMCTLDSGGQITCDNEAPLNIDNNIPTESGFTRLSCGNSHACAVHESGDGVCWGGDQWGKTVVP